MYTRKLPDWLRACGCAYVYWIMFLLALEPGNVLHARSVGSLLAFDREALRIGVASLLACSTAPLILALNRRYPIFAGGYSRSIAIHAAGAATLSCVLILISCLLAAWMFMGEAAALGGRKYAASSRRTGCCLRLRWARSPFSATRWTDLDRRRDPTRRVDADRIPVKTRGRLSYVDLASLEWIEAQGNYLALHVGGRSHLIRATLRAFSGAPRSAALRPRPPARDRGHRSSARNSTAHEWRLDLDPAEWPGDSRQPQLSQILQGAVGRGRGTAVADSLTGHRPPIGSRRTSA